MHSSTHERLHGATGPGASAGPALVAALAAVTLTLLADGHFLARALELDLGGDGKRFSGAALGLS